MGYYYDPKHKASYDNVQDTIQRYRAFMNNYPALSKANNQYLDVSNKNLTDLDVDTEGNAESISNFLTLGGGGAATLAGNAAGLGLKYLANKSLQEQQFENQKELQQRAFNMNQKAAQLQAQNEVIGLQNAGLSPAMANGGGAPTIQAGAAAGATTDMGNIFAGLSEIINALKAPTEIDKLKAEKELTEAQTEKTGSETSNIESQTALNEQQYELINPLSAEQIEASTKSLVENTKTASNFNEAWSAENNYLKETAYNKISNTVAEWKSNGTWNKLDAATKAEYESILSGNKELGIGEINALQKSLNTSTTLTANQKENMNTALNTAILSAQMKDPKVMEAYKKLPEDQRNELYSRIKKNNAEIAQLYELVAVGKTQEALNKANELLANQQKEATKYQRESAQTVDYPWQTIHGTPEGAEYAKAVQSYQWFRGKIDETFSESLGALKGYATGRGFGGKKGGTVSTTIKDPKTNTTKTITRDFNKNELKNFFK